MLKVIKAKLLSSNIPNILQPYHIDSTHSFVRYADLMEICKLYQKHRNQIINLLSRQLLNCTKKAPLKPSHLTYKIKLMLIAHQLLKQNLKDPELQELLLNYNEELIASEDFGGNRIAKSDKIEQFELFRFIYNEIFVQYGQYVQKFCVNLQSISFISQFFTSWKDSQLISSKGIGKKQVQANLMYRHQSLQLINHGFTILNLGNCILNMKDALNKMGRYHEQFNQIKSIFLVLAKDLDIYNQYIKRSLAIVMRRNMEKEEQDQQKQWRIRQKQKRDQQRRQKSKSKSKCKSKSKQKQNRQVPTPVTFKKVQQISISNISLNTKKLKKQHSTDFQSLKQKNRNLKEKQEINHGFLYMCECQKLSDRLYYFYFNRYYYKKLGDEFVFPSFLKIDVKYENIMKNRLRRYDRNLLHIIKASKYDQPYQQTRKRSKTTDYLNKTQGNVQNLTSSISKNHINYTMYDKEDDDMTTKNSLQICFPDYDLACIKKPVQLFITEEQ